MAAGKASEDGAKILSPAIISTSNIRIPKHYHGFRFNLDFFAAAADGMWWHDHRFPGGIAFTANATGHMRAFMDWYREPGRDHGAWAVTQAMMTIARSHPTKPIEESDKTEKTARAEGRVTWLLDLKPRGRYPSCLG